MERTITGGRWMNVSAEKIFFLKKYKNYYAKESARNQHSDSLFIDFSFHLNRSSEKRESFRFLRSNLCPASDPP